MYQASNTNAAQKVCRILKTLSQPDPMRLSDIAAGAEVNATTALRILETLVQEGFVNKDPAHAKRYMLGDAALTLGIAMQGRDHIRDRVRPALLRLAAVSSDTALASVRQGLDAVCIDREFGDFPIRWNHLDIGGRRPLGVGSVGLALLAWQPAAERETIVELIAPRLLSRYPRLTPLRLQQEIERSLGNGYAVLLDVVVERIGGVAVPIFGADGRPVAALGIAGLSDRIASRLPALAKALQKEAAALSVTESALRES